MRETRSSTSFSCYAAESFEGDAQHGCHRHGKNSACDAPEDEPRSQCEEDNNGVQAQERPKHSGLENSTYEDVYSQGKQDSRRLYPRTKRRIKEYDWQRSNGSHKKTLQGEVEGRVGVSKSLRPAANRRVTLTTLGMKLSINVSTPKRCDK